MQQDIRSNQNRTLALGAILGGLTSLPVIALSYLGSKLVDLPFVPFDVFDWLARVLPGGIITIGIDSMVRTIELLGLGRISGTAKTIEQGMGVVLVIIAGGVLGLVTVFLQARKLWSSSTIGRALGILAFMFVAGIELMLGSAIAGNMLGSLIWLAILFVGWGVLLSGWLAAPELMPVTMPRAAEPSAMAVTSNEVPASAANPSRRVFLTKLVGGSLGIAVVATGVGRMLQMQSEASGAGQALTSVGTPTPDAMIAVTGAAMPTPVTQETAAATARDRIQPAPGTRPEVTANNDFYRTDIDTLPLVIDKASWKLQVTGLFDKPRSMTLADFQSYPAVTQPVTMSCISNPVAGDLISTSNWVGVRVRDVLKDLGLNARATALAITSADGFYESVSMQDLMDPRTLFIYGMNGETLPAVHGFPLRIYIPNRYGMKQPKWIVAIEAIDHNGPGYWVDRGWSETAYPQIVSVIDNIATNQVVDGRVPIGGIAWAGDRGIKTVQVQVDGGPWVDAVLRTPTLSPLTWVQWRYDWPLVRGSHRFTVRAIDGTGAIQIQNEADTYPDGATGYHSVSKSV